MHNKKYSNVNEWHLQELLGCVKSVRKSAGVIITKLVGLIGLYRDTDTAEKLRAHIAKEAEGSGVHVSEYVINELQRELRIAKGFDTPDMEKEKELTDRWIRHVIRNEGEDAGLDFVNALTANRQKRYENISLDFL